MFFVIYSHIPSVNIWRFHDYFFLVGFIFCSGYTFSVKNGLKFRFIRIADSLIIPYFFFGFVMYFFDYNHLLFFKNDPCGSLLANLYDIVMGKAVWFIPCIISIEIIYMLAVKFKITTFVTTGCAILYLSGLINNHSLPWHIDTATYFIFFFHFGYMLKHHKLQPAKISNAIILPFLLIFIICSNMIYKLYPFNTSINYFTNEPITMMVNIVGVLVLVLVAGKMKMNWYIEYIGKNTLLLFYIHLPFVYYIYKGANQFINLDSPYFNNAVMTILYVFLITLLLYPIVKLISKSPILSGKGKVIEYLYYKKQ